MGLNLDKKDGECHELMNEKNVSALQINVINLGTWKIPIYHLASHLWAIFGCASITKSST